VCSSEVFRVECSSEVICMSDPEKLALTSPTSGSRSVGIVRSRTQATELVSSSGVLSTRVLVKCIVQEF
jgi:hypothetical protein